MKSIAAAIEEMRQMTVAQLVDRYAELFGKPPRVKNRQHLWKRCAWKLQETKLGGLSLKAKARLEELIEELDLPFGKKANKAKETLRGRKGSNPSVGTTLTRQYKGQEIRVQVLENGFDHDGVIYRSLSAVAKAVTGSAWNGKLFFGLTKRSRGS